MTNKTIYIPYTYCITFLLTGQRYYGCKYANNKNDVSNPKDFWVSYFTSSKEIKELIAIHGKEAFTCQIRQTFKTKEETILWEHKFLTRINAASNPEWFNKSNSAGKFHTTKESIEKELATRNARTPEQKQAIREKRLVTLNARTLEQKQAQQEKRIASMNARTLEEKLAQREKTRDTTDTKTPEEKRAIQEKRIASMNAKTPEEKRATKEKTATTKATRTPEEKRAIQEKRIASMNAKTPEEKRASEAKRLATKAKNKLLALKSPEVKEQ